MVTPTGLGPASLYMVDNWAGESVVVVATAVVVVAGAVVAGTVLLGATVLGAAVDGVRAVGDGIAVDVTTAAGVQVLEGDCLLVAMGRISNADQLDVSAGGIATDNRGFVQVDEHGRTSSPGVWALGDINGRHQLKHMANGEARVVRHNLTHPDALQVLDPRPAPHAVFSSPQIAAVGLTEEQAKASGKPYCVAVQ